MSGSSPPTGGTSDFASWYREAFPDVAATLTLACGDPDLADEAAAEAFARALASWRRVGAMASPTGWVYTVALNEIRRHWRRGRLERRAVARHAGLRGTDCPAPAAPDHELWRAVAALAPRQREAIALRYIADLTEAQVADAMGVRRGTAAATLSVARRTLAETLGHRALADDAPTAPPGVAPVRTGDQAASGQPTPANPTSVRPDDGPRPALPSRREHLAAVTPAPVRTLHPLKEPS